MNPRKKGHAAEREYVNIFKELHPFCKTSREASRLYDNCKIDIWGMPALVQIKAGYPKGVSYSKVLEEMEEELGKNFPEDAEEHGLPKFIIHKKNPSKRGRGVRRPKNDTLVVMSFEDFFNHYYHPLQCKSKNLPSIPSESISNPTESVRAS